MNERQILEAAMDGISRPTVKEDKRSFWIRLLCSLRISAKPSTNIKKPIKEINITGGADF